MNNYNEMNVKVNTLDLQFEEICAFPDEMLNEVKENTENIQKIYDRVKEILEYDFDAIYSYFLEILEKQYDYMVLMSRRCLVLYQVFMYFYILDNIKISCRSRIISDKALPYYLPEFNENESVAIVDDIIVHGRTVCSTYDIIKEVCPGAHIDIYGYSSEQNIDCMSEEVKEKTDVAYVASTHEWRKLSNKIVSSILTANVPYTSFVTSYFQYDESFIQSIEEKKDKILLIVNTGGSQKDEKITSYCVFENTWNKPPIFSSLSLGECIRMYWNDCTKKLTVIPYVFLRSLSANDVKTIIDDLDNLWPEECLTIKNVFKLKRKTSKAQKALSEYKMRVLTCCLSNYYWRSFLDRYSLPEPQYADMDTIVKSFGISVACELKMLTTDNLGKMIDYSFASYNDVLDEREKLSNNKLQKLVLEHEYTTKIRKWLGECFYSAWAEDEQRAKEKKARALGLALESLLARGKELGYNRHSILSELVNNWDVGIAAANFSFDSNKKVMGCYVTSGEQSYKILLENNANIMYALITVSNMITKDDASKQGKSFEKYRVDLLLELLDKYNANKRLLFQDYKNIKLIIEQDQGYLNAWDQAIVWGSPMSDSNRAIMTEFIQEKF